MFMLYILINIMGAQCNRKFDEIKRVKLIGIKLFYVVRNSFIAMIHKYNRYM